MNLLDNLLSDDYGFNKIIATNKDKNQKIYITGIGDSAKNFLISSLAKNTNSSSLILTYNDIQAKVIYDDLNFFLKDLIIKDELKINIFISRPHLLYNIDAGSQDIFSIRQQAIVTALSNQKSIIICSIEAFITNLIPKTEYLKNIVNIKLGQSIALEEFSKQIVNAGYNIVDVVKNKGQASKKGGIFDIYTLDSNVGYRIEFFDNEIDSIRTFDVETQRSVDHVEEVTIYPARELLFNDDARKKATESLKNDIDVLSRKIKKHSDKEAFLEKFNHVLGLIENNMHIDGIEKYIGYFYENTDSILDYMSDETTIFLDEPNRMKQRYENIKLEFDEMINSIIEKGQYLYKYSSIMKNYDEVVLRIGLNKIIAFNYMDQPVKDFEFYDKINLSSRTINSFQGNLNEMVQDINEMRRKKYKSFIICTTEAQAERMQEELSSYDLKTHILKLDSEEKIQNYDGALILIGGIHKGFAYEINSKVSNSASGIYVINNSDIFGSSLKKKARKKVKKGERLKSFTDLKVGDYVVHINHGIGTYVGIEQLVMDNVTKDYLKIVYQGGDNLYVPTNQLDLIQKYVGAGEKEPKLNKLGGNEWTKIKNRVKKSVEDIALKLIELYAKRQMTKGYQFSNDNVWQTQFEDMFPYQETDDQLQSIAEIKKDMEESKVMDRLLCGDVGYGKTEVAMRAAFKAVQDNKQVAYLVPTTVLAHQQYMNFITRFKEFPINIGLLSRFRTPIQQKQVIQKAKTGEIDIIIGTHRLIQKDVKFKDLGLIIIDEEQRFGVKHKEKLKELKKDVDVLTLTATPIPRTLHMSMVGIRDISVIEEPPLERHPVQTYVMEYNDELVKDAIIRELARGGQVFYVYNRVESINECAARIKRMLPDCRICVGHGQMGAGELEDRIMEFLDGEYDVLVCTTIIETGIDMPNVNTLIVENADKMGLSQLYQLRGRVGRSNKIAYAYFTHKRDKILSEVAEKRLQAIKEFTEFGSGFKIALRDLEIRGAGNLLGAEQHGHMESIGYDMYCTLLEQAIKRLKGEEVEEEFDTLIDLAVDAYIPESYIKDEIQKIEMYKKVAAIDSEGDVILLQEEFTDRFGDMPLSVENLIQISYIKYLAKIFYVDSIVQRNNNIILQFLNADRFNISIINELLSGYKNRIVFEPKEKPTIKFMLKELKQDTILKELKTFMKDINNFSNKSIK